MADYYKNKMLYSKPTKNAPWNIDSANQQIFTEHIPGIIPRLDTVVNKISVKTNTEIIFLFLNKMLSLEGREGVRERGKFNNPPKKQSKKLKFREATSLHPQRVNVPKIKAIKRPSHIIGISKDTW